MCKKLVFLNRGDAKMQALFDRAWNEVGIGHANRNYRMNSASLYPNCMR
jgi:hypothetical protein